MKLVKYFTICLIFYVQIRSVFAQSSEVKDMSDPLAVYTSVGIGAATYGMYLFLGKTYNASTPGVQGMNILEFKGWAGDTIGWDRTSKKDSNLDSIRFRNFEVELAKGRGSQIDFDYNVDQDSGYLSYSLIQAIPEFGPFFLYPLAGVGASITNQESIDSAGDISDDGFKIPGLIYVIGMYAKIVITEKIWLNYNPTFFKTLTGSASFEDNAFGAGNSDILNHEFVASYQFTPRFNIRYFAGWSSELDIANGAHRVQLNFQI